MMIVLDAHQDIAYNYLKYGRDYRRSALVTRTQEPAGTEAATIGLPEALAGRVALIFSTLMLMYTIIAVESHHVEEHEGVADVPEGGMAPPLSIGATTH